MRDTLAHLHRLGVPIGTIIDVGVNHSTPMLMQAFPKHKHILVEPISDYFPAIRQNYAGMDFQLIEAAAGETDGAVHIKSHKLNGDGKVSHSEIVGEAGPDTREVPCLRLDTMIPPLGLAEPYLLKVDVEGMEIAASILRGATETMKKSTVVVVELTATRFMERASVVHAAGFQLFDIVDAVYYRGALAQVDGIFIRNDLAETIPELRPMANGKFDLKYWKPVRRPIWERAAAKARVLLGA